MKLPSYVVLAYIESVLSQGWLCVYVGDDRASAEWSAEAQRALGHEAVIVPVTAAEEVPTN